MYVIPVKCYNLEGRTQHEVPTFQGLKTWWEEKTTVQ